jgi:2-dehydropantoate 2-reductase
MRAVMPAGLGRDHPLVLLAVKSQHTADALGELAPRLAPDGAVVSLQNGLNEEVIADAVGAARTIGCLVNWAADWLGPGRILHGGPGAFVVGELDGRITPRVEALARMLGAVEPARVSDNVLGFKWAKLVYAPLLFATAVVDAHVYEVVERSPGVQRALASLVGEGLAAVAGDAAARARAMAAAAAHYRASAKTKTGVWRDLAVRRRPTEVDGLLGTLVRKGEALGVAMPLTRRLIEIIHDLEAGRRRMDWSNLDPLVATAPGAGGVAR